MWNKPYRKTDVEAGNSTPLYPMMLESAELRWAFIRKVYSIIAFQVLLTIVVAAIVANTPRVGHFLVDSWTGFGIYIAILIVPIIVLFPLYFYQQKHPVNYILLLIFTIFIALAVGLGCSFEKGKVLLESVILTAVVIVTLTLYTFWAARRGQDFHFIGPFLFGALAVLVVFGFIQIFLPMGRISTMIYGCLAAVIFCGYIVYDTDNLIKRFSYDDYIWASVSLYLDVVNLFLSLLTVFSAADS